MTTIWNRICLVCTSVVILFAVHAWCEPPAPRTSAGLRGSPSFEANVCQTSSGVRFIARDTRFILTLSGDGANIAMSGPEREGSLIRMSWSGRKGDPVAERQLPGRVNYLVGRDPANWCSNIPTFARVRYAAIYPGVDLTFRSVSHTLEYDLVVSPGADPRAVRLRFEGAAVSLDAAGDLLLKTSTGILLHHRPLIYQTIAHKHKRIRGGYKLDGDRVSFKVASYDPRYALVIDPVLAYSTYLGGSEADAASSIAIDANHCAYVTGTTLSLDFPVKNALQSVGNAYTAFVTKFSATGGAIVYSTYFGANSSGTGIAVDRYANAYFTGVAIPSGTPGKIIGTIDANTQQAFVAKLDPTGTKLVYSLIFGGNVGAFATAIALDSTQHAYITGSTQSSNFPTTPGAYKTASAGGGFVVKLNAAGTGLAYATYLTVDSSPYPLGIAVTPTGQAFVTGSVAGDYPTTSGAFQRVPPTKLPCFCGRYQCTCPSGFVTKFNSSGSGLLYSTLIAGNAEDYCKAITIDHSGNAYVTGQTSSRNFPTTLGAFRRTAPSTSYFAFVTKVNPTGSSLSYSTLLTGPGGSDGNSISVNSLGQAFVTGFAGSGFPLKNAVRTSGLLYVTKLAATGSGLVWSTRFGGLMPNNATITLNPTLALRLDGLGNTYVAGGTVSTNFPTTAGGYQTTIHGTEDAFLFKLTN